MSILDKIKQLDSNTVQATMSHPMWAPPLLQYTAPVMAPGYNRPVTPIRGGLPGPLPGFNPQHGLPLFLQGPGEDLQGNSSQLQPQAGRTSGGRTLWHAPVVPLKAPLRVFTA